MRVYLQRPPPPSYEESQRMYLSAPNHQNHGAPNQISTPYMQTCNYNATSSYMQSYTAAAPPPQYYQHHYVTATAPPTFNNVKEPHVLSLAPGAKLRTTAAGAKDNTCGSFTLLNVGGAVAVT